MHPLVRVEELAAHLDDPGRVVFDCRHDLMAPAAGEALYRESHVAGARFASLDRDLSGPKDGTNGTPPAADARRVRRVPRRRGRRRRQRHRRVRRRQRSLRVAALVAGALGRPRRRRGPRRRPRRLAGRGLPVSDAPPPQASGGIRLRPPLVSLVDTADVEADPRVAGDARRRRARAGTLSRRGRAARPGRRPHPARRQPSDGAQPRSRRPLQGRRSAARGIRRDPGRARSADRRPVVRVGRDRLPQPARDGSRRAAGRGPLPGSWSAWCSDPSRPVERSGSSGACS